MIGRRVARGVRLVSDIVLIVNAVAHHDVRWGIEAAEEEAEVHRRQRGGFLLYQVSPYTSR
jgi:sRNA-binding carbon storage regulator CsrA